MNQHQCKCGASKLAQSPVCLSCFAHALRELRAQSYCPDPELRRLARIELRRFAKTRNPRRLLTHPGLNPTNPDTIHDPH